MRFKFFPGSELSPPQLLGGIVDLDHPQHLVANLFAGEENGYKIEPLKPLAEEQMEELETFASNIPTTAFKRVAVADIMAHTSRRKSMC